MGTGQLTHTTAYPLRNHCGIDRSTSCQHVSCGPLTSMFYGLDVMDCNVKPNLAGGFQSPQGAPQGEITKGTFVKGHLCAYLNLMGFEGYSVDNRAPLLCRRCTALAPRQKSFFAHADGHDESSGAEKRPALAQLGSQLGVSMPVNFCARSPLSRQRTKGNLRSRRAIQFSWSRYPVLAPFYP